jgi:SAM-dependent methyltransferase
MPAMRGRNRNCPTAALLAFDLTQTYDSRMSEDAERIIDIYDRNAALWDGDRLRILFEKSWLDRFLGLVPIGGSILDIGCGTAEPIARYLIEAECIFTGVDSSPAMIDICKSRFPNHVWLVADMRTLSVPRRFNGLIAWDSFFHLTHDAQRRMFPIFCAHAAPNAALLFTSGPSHSESMGSYRGEPLYHSSLDEAEYRSLLNRNGFDVVAHVADDPDCDRHTVWLARLI